MDDRSKKILELACKFIEKQGCLWAEFDGEGYSYQFYGGRRFQCGTSEKEQGSKMNLPFEVGLIFSPLGFFTHLNKSYFTSFIFLVFNLTLTLFETETSTV